MKDHARGRKVGEFNTFERGTEVREGGQHLGRIVWRRTDPNTEVFGGSNMAVGGEGMGPNDQILNVMVVEGAYEIDEV